MPVDPQVQFLLDQLAALDAPAMDSLTPDDIRQQMRAQLALFGEPEPIAHIEDHTIPGPQGAIPLRIFTPDGSGSFPLLVFFHGGGWVIGDLDTHDGLCRSLANKDGCVV